MNSFSNVLAVLDDVLAPALSPLSLPIANALNLPYFAVHFPTFVFALILFQTTFLAAGALLPFISKHYNSSSKRTRYQWRVKTVSQVNALLLVPLSLVCYGSDSLDADRVYGWDPKVGRLSALACGYFFWDTLETIFCDGGLQFILHGFACLCIFGFSFRPFIAYYSPRALIWEASTPFLNIHWWLDKTGRTGSAAQLFNAVLLVTSFFLVRVVYGGYITYGFWKTLYSIRDTLPPTLLWTYLLGNAALNLLNWIWLFKMFAAMSKRFPSKDENAKRSKI